MGKMRRRLLLAGIIFFAAAVGAKRTTGGVGGLKSNTLDGKTIDSVIDCDAARIICMIGSGFVREYHARDIAIRHLARSSLSQFPAS